MEKRLLVIALVLCRLSCVDSQTIAEVVAADYPNNVNSGNGCPAGQFSCLDAANTCIDFALVRDCTNDCPNGADEECPTSAGWILCDIGIQCADRRGPKGCGRCATLDASGLYPACFDRYNAKLANEIDAFPCVATQNYYVSIAELDGEDDCGDASDEDTCFLSDPCPGELCTFDPCQVPPPTVFAAQYLGPLPTYSAQAAICTAITTAPPVTTIAATTIAPTTAAPIIIVPTAPCAGNGFRCLDSAACVDLGLVLDGNNNCTDGSDEVCLDPNQTVCPNIRDCVFDTTAQNFTCLCPTGTVSNGQAICVPDFSVLPSDCSEVSAFGPQTVYTKNPTCQVPADCAASVICPDPSTLGIDPATPIGPGWTIVAEGLAGDGSKDRAQYEAGFTNDTTGTTFAGLDYLSGLGSDPAATEELLVLVEFEGGVPPPALIRYDSFQVAPGVDNYALNLGNQLTEQELGSLVSGSVFSTQNNGDASACASSGGVGWWWDSTCNETASLAPTSTLNLLGATVKDVKLFIRPLQNCTANKMFECTTIPDCVDTIAVLDGKLDCFDGSDEAPCGGDAILAASCPDGCVFNPSTAKFQCRPCPAFTLNVGGRCEPDFSALPKDCTETAKVGAVDVYKQSGCDSVSACLLTSVNCPGVASLPAAEPALGSGWTMISRGGEEGGTALNPNGALNGTLADYGTGFGDRTTGPFHAGLDYASEMTVPNPGISAEAALVITYADGTSDVVRYGGAFVDSAAGGYGLNLENASTSNPLLDPVAGNWLGGPFSTAESGPNATCASALGVAWWISSLNCDAADNFAPAASLDVIGKPVADVQFLLRPIAQCGGKFACADGNGCAEDSQVRDGRPECADSSDEDSCGGGTLICPAGGECVYNPALDEFRCNCLDVPQYISDGKGRCRPDFSNLPSDCSDPTAPSNGGSFVVFADDGICMTLAACSVTVQCTGTSADPAASDWILVKAQQATAPLPSNSWDTYKNGFGDPQNESYYIGNDALRKLALQGAVEMRLELIPAGGGPPIELTYEDFALGLESEGFPLALGTLKEEGAQTLVDVLRASVGRPFSTTDRGPDAACAAQKDVGWWFDGPCANGTCASCDAEGNLNAASGQIFWDGMAIGDVKILIKPAVQNECQKQGKYQCKFISNICISDNLVVENNPTKMPDCPDFTDENLCMLNGAFTGMRDCTADANPKTCVYNPEQHSFGCQCPPGTSGDTEARTGFCLPDITKLARNCEELGAGDPAARSGTTYIYPQSDKSGCLSRAQCEVPTFCELEDLAGFGSGWTVIQARSIGGPTYDRTFNDYKSGYGRPTTGDFYIGNDIANELTAGGIQDLLVELTGPSGDKRYVRYYDFKVGTEADVYKLSLGDMTSGTGTDEFSTSKSKQFSAFDGGQEPDCADQLRAGWWMNNGCSLDGNLNGELWDGSGRPSVSWDGEAVKAVRMLVRGTRTEPPVAQAQQPVQPVRQGAVAFLAPSPLLFIIGSFFLY